MISNKYEFEKPNVSNFKPWDIHQTGTIQKYQYINFFFICLSPLNSLTEQKHVHIKQLSFKIIKLNFWLVKD